MDFQDGCKGYGGQMGVLLHDLNKINRSCDSYPYECLKMKSSVTLTTSCRYGVHLFFNGGGGRGVSLGGSQIGSTFVHLPAARGAFIDA